MTEYYEGNEIDCNNIEHYKGIKWLGFKVKEIKWTEMECEIDVIYIAEL
jgi:hypothetical protein